MAIKMVRQPSETPNINNIDDIVGLRYAYGDQNGYVIGKGNELSYSINGSNFTINSGRVVLQGAESDIDANGVTITVNNIATKEYYTVYYEVNLATNTTSIKSQTDTAGYPSIDKGDDLTQTTSGTARLELYHFTAQNGVISDVNKLIKPIKYTKDIEVENAKKINGVTLDIDDKDILRVDDSIISQKKLIWSGDIIDSSRSNYLYFTNLPTLDYKKYLFEIHWNTFRGNIIYELITSVYGGDASSSTFQAEPIYSTIIDPNGSSTNSFLIAQPALGSHTATEIVPFNEIIVSRPGTTDGFYKFTEDAKKPCLKKIYEIIE